MAQEPHKRSGEAAHQEAKSYWLDQPRNIMRIYWGLWIVCGLLALADLFYHKHAEFSFAEFPASYGIYGFVCFVFIVFAGKLLRKVVMRDEDYYDR
ncbi:MAG: hypothetical protein AAF530_23090 [Pseudomonadota bacterium]